MKREAAASVVWLVYYTDEMRLQDLTKAEDFYCQFQSPLNIPYSMNMIIVLLAKLFHENYMAQDTL